MHTGLLIKTLYSTLLSVTGGLNYRLSQLPPKTSTILTYHRVLPRAIAQNVEPGMYVTPETLHNHIQVIKKYYNITSINDCFNYSDSDKPNCVFTFDDGWSDFLNYAWPLLESERVPATVYLPTGLISTGTPFWTDRLRHILLNDGFDTLAKLLKNQYGKIFHKKNTQVNEELISQAISFLKEIPSLEIDQILTQIEATSHLPKASSQTGRPFLTWDEIRTLARTKLITFGSHTVNHEILTTVSPDQIITELQESHDQLIKEGVGTTNEIPFCYPNGNHNKQIADHVAHQGYTNAVTCNWGVNNGATHRFALNRLSMHEDISSTKALFMYRLTRTC